MNSAASAQDAPIAAEPFLAVRGLDKRFGATEVLRGIDLDIARGAFTCLIGPSGSGKTTLLRIICGIEAASGGSVLCEGRELSALPPAARRMGMVFQSYALFPNLRVAQNIAFGLPRTLKRADRSKRIASLLETVGLNGYERRRPDELSGGQQQRVAIARALASEPSILLLDEPLSALDLEVRTHLRGELKALQRRLGVTTVLVTHDQSEALALADMLAVMQDGRIAQAGTPVELYNRPRTGFVARFLGAMNLLPATMVANRMVRLANGAHIATPSNPFPPDSRVELGIRPEHVRICRPDDIPDLVLSVARREFAGATMRFEAVQPGTAFRLLVDVPADLSPSGIGEGAPLRLALPMERLHLFAAEGA